MRCLANLGYTAQYMTDTVSYRLMKPGEEEEAFAMVERAFNAFVRDGFSPDGVKECCRSMRDNVFTQRSDHFILVAESGGHIVGMIGMKEYDHVSMFFVEPSRMGEGIGRGLFTRAVTLCQQEKPDLKEIEVHSSPWAVAIYEKLGFSATGPEREEGGLRYTRMVKTLEPQSG